MAFYNERGERIIAIFHNGVLVSDDPSIINFTGNVEVIDDGMGEVTVNILGGSGDSIGFETPVGLINSSNVTFAVSNIPIYVVLNGNTYFEGDGYTLTGLTITMLVVPMAGSTFQSAYQ